MIKISILYPAVPGGRFDVDYYVQKHMPMSLRLLSPALRGATVDEGVRTESPELQTPYVAMSHLLFDSLEAFKAAFAPHAATLTGDMPNYTDIRPIIQMSEVRIHFRPSGDRGSA
jgi:uncharacterized protein (TIGR02118 family)